MEQETLEVMESPTLTKRFAIHFVGVVLGAYVLASVVGANQFYFCMIAPAVWLVSAFVYQSKLKAENNREAFDDMEAEMHTAKNQLTQSIVMIRKLQPLATALQSVQAELQSAKEKLQSLEHLAQSQTDRAVELSRLLESEKQSRANERTIAIEEIANATKQIATAKAIADKALATAVANAENRLRLEYAPLLELAPAVVGYKNCESALATPARREALGPDRVEALRIERESHKAVVDAFVESYNNAKIST